MDKDIVVVSYARTAFDRFGGVTRNLPSIQLVKAVIIELIKRTGLPPQAFSEVNLGQCVLIESGLQTDIVARQALILAGLPEETLSMTIDRACCSSTSALQLSIKNLRLGESEISMVLGADQMSRVPFILAPEMRWEGRRMGSISLVDGLFMLGYAGFNPLAVDAGEVALENGIGRQLQDEWALMSHQKYGAAVARDFFSGEIFPLEIDQGPGKAPAIFQADAQPRPDTTLEKLSKLPTVYGSPTITGGNAPGLNTGATGMVITTRAKARQLGLTPLATVIDVVSIARKSREIAVAPAPAIQRALQAANLKLDDIKLIEINEAFAAMPLLATKLLADGDPVKTDKLRSITNVNGGAVAIGHPVGASGLRITMTLINELTHRGGGYGVAAICGGLAQGDAVILKVD